MGLEEQLIRGAGEAVAKDPYGRVQRAKDIATGKITQGLMGIGKSLATKKKELDDEFDRQSDEFLKNAGSLGSEYYDKAYDYVKGDLKNRFNDCKRKDQKCRDMATIDLNNYIQEIAGVKEDIKGITDTRAKEKAGTLKISEGQTTQQKEKLNQIIGGGNYTSIGSNDEQIKKLQTKLESGGVKGFKNRKLRKQLEEKLNTLKNTNKLEWGWDVVTTDAKGNEIQERLTRDDINKLQPLRNDVASKAAKDNLVVRRTQASDYKSGKKGSMPFYENDIRTEGSELITEENISSFYHDDLMGGNALKKDLELHPLLTDMQYSDIGLDASRLDTDPEDGIIDASEIDKLTEEDRNLVIDALSNKENPHFDFETSKQVALDYYVEKNKKESNIALYNHNQVKYYGTSDVGPDKKYATLDEKQKAIELRARTPGPDETKEQFIERGGILGAIDNEKFVWDKESSKWIETVAYSDKTARGLVAGKQESDNPLTFGE